MSRDEDDGNPVVRPHQFFLSNVAKEGEGAADAKEILSLYKEQHGVEQNLAFLKHPAVVNAIFLKTEERIEALGLILLISLLIWRLIERKLRKHVDETGQALTGWDNKPTTSPTALMITSKFRNTTVIRIGSQRRLNRPLNPIQLEWLEALGLKPAIFTSHPELDEHGQTGGCKNTHSVPSWGAECEHQLFCRLKAG